MANFHHLGVYLGVQIAFKVVHNGGVLNLARKKFPWLSLASNRTFELVSELS